MDEAETLEEKWERLRGLRTTLRRRQEAVDLLTRQVAELQAEIVALSGTATQAFKVGSAPGYGGVREEILRLLAQTPDGIESTAIGKLLAARFGDAVGSRSHLTTLSRLREAGIATKVDGRWRLTADGFGVYAMY